MRFSKKLKQFNEKHFYFFFLPLSFAVLYLVTQSPVFSGDGAQWLEVMINGDPKHPNFGDAGHFLGVPLAHYLWKFILDPIGITARASFLGLNLFFALSSIVFFGLLAEFFIASKYARWLAAILFGISLHTWFQWNGEIYSASHAFLFAAFYFFLRGRFWLPAVMWALSVLFHSEFCLVFLAFPVAYLKGKLATKFEKKARQKTFEFWVASGALTLLGLVLGGLIIGKWHSISELTKWLFEGIGIRKDYMSQGINPLKAIKGLFTAFSVGGQFLGDVVTRRAQWSHPWFLTALTASLFVFAASAFFVRQSFKGRKLFWFATMWLLGVHVLFNWRLLPQVDEYHAAGFPALILLIVDGIWVFSGPSLGKKLMAAHVFVIVAFLLNLFGGLLPAQRFGTKVLISAAQIKVLASTETIKPIVLTCDDEMPVHEAGLPSKTVKSFLIADPAAPLTEIRQKIIQWVQLESIERPVYLLGDSCRAEHWKQELVRAEPIDQATALFSFEFLRSGALFKKTEISDVPLNFVSQTNPFSWRYADLYIIRGQEGP